MSGWALSLITDPGRELDAASLSALAACTDERQIAQLELRTARAGQSLSVGELFRVRRCAAESIVIQGELSFLNGLGSEWATRSLLVEGNVGSGLGVKMRSGSIEVRGNTAAHAAQQLKGGTIRIHGNTGDYLGGPLPGRRSGMSGGRVIVAGQAGHHAGHRMRRGWIVVQGDCGAGVASDMVAGTMVVGGVVGDHVAAGMKRGTLILARSSHLSAVRFAPSRPSSLGIARLIANDLRADIPDMADAFALPMSRYLGDRSCGGQGEVWLLETAEDAD